MTVRKYSSRSQQTTLVSQISASATSATVVSASALLGGITIAAGEVFTVVIDPDTSLEEIVDATSRSVNNLIFTRGRDGSVAQDHSAGAIVRHMAIGRDYREANLHLKATTAYNDGTDTQSLHGIGAGEGDIVGTVKTQTLTNKTLGGNLAAGGYKVTGLGTPTSASDSATKTYVDTADALKLNLSGGTMSGAIAMGTLKITGLGDPTSGQDAATKNYVDTGAVNAAASATSSATSASSSATSASSAATSASSAATSASSAATSATSATASASAAATLATSAATSVTAAASSETSATSSATAAATSATSAAASASSAAVSADLLSDSNTQISFQVFG